MDKVGQACGIRDVTNQRIRRKDEVPNGEPGIRNRQKQGPTTAPQRSRSDTVDRDRNCKGTKAVEVIAVGTHVETHECQNVRTDRRTKSSPSERSNLTRAETRNHIGNL
ncbi:hypothetical protein R1flu_002409 [Riccia fluitans]|uniref:Uncharacterized protein n=1 Tax=Riccia fluitans TaxID=41844 RepID=A0ABD1Y9V7_9MARC